MARIPQEKLNEIRSSVDIVDVIGQYLSLTKKGNNYVAICPFHQDTNPSLSISPSKQIYKCFVCNAGGNAITFLQNHLNISFIEAVKKIAEMGNVDLSEYNLEYKKQEIKKELVNLYKINEEANNIYSYYLNTKLGVEAKSYLNKRHFNEELITKYNIGYAPSESILYNSFKKNYSDIDIVNSGLVLESKSHYDRFNDRIIFPIHDSEGRVVGFSGRIYKVTQSDSKYLNSPESDIFIKGSILYNYHRCKESVRKKGFVYLLEGFMDVIALDKAGIENTIALMGTALTKRHIQMIRRITNTVHICLDGDSAGIRGAHKAMNTLKTAGFNVKIILLPKGKDPDEVYESSGKNELIANLNKVLLPIEFSMEYKYNTLNVNNYEDRKNFLQEICLMISEIKDDIDKDYYIKRLSEKSGFSEDVINKLITKDKDEAKNSNHIIYMPKDEYKIENKYVAAQKELLHYMLRSGEVTKKFEDKFCYMHDDNCRHIASYIIDYYHNNDKLKIADFIDSLPSQEFKNLVIEIDGLNIPESNGTDVNDYLDILNKKSNELRIQELQEQMRHISDPNKKASIAQEIINLERRN